jgi:hypothetical protein
VNVEAARDFEIGLRIGTARSGGTAAARPVERAATISVIANMRRFTTVTMVTSRMSSDRPTWMNRSD